MNKNTFWSRTINDHDLIPDEIIIEKVLRYPDPEEIELLFNLYGKEKIRKVLFEKILSQEPYYHSLNVSSI